METNEIHPGWVDNFDDVVELRASIRQHAASPGGETIVFDCVLANYHVHRVAGRSLVFGGDAYLSYLGLDDVAPPAETRWSIDHGLPREESPILHPALVRTTTERMRFRADLDGPVRVHRGCVECDPIVSRAPHGLVEHEPWCAWALVFERGVLLRIDPIQIQTRDELRSELIVRFHLDVLDDADPDAAERIAAAGSASRRR